MHPNALLLQRLFSSLDRKDHETMATCYHPDATFHDIAFSLRGKSEIHDMWRMVCAGDIRATFEVLHADDATGRVRVIDDYTFSDTGRKVRNVIESRFTFQDHLVVEHRDTCDPRAWAAMAIGGVRGFLAGRISPLRRFKAGRKLKRFVAEHPAPA
jgi:ketosteroid isomerase-like protein